METKHYNFRIEVEEKIDYDDGGNKIGDLEFRLYKMPENKIVEFAYGGNFQCILNAIDNMIDFYNVNSDDSDE